MFLNMIKLLCSKVAYLESLGAAGDRGEDVIAVHGSQDELRAVPDLGAGRVPTLEARGPTLQTGHADS